MKKTLTLTATYLDHKDHLIGVQCFHSTYTTDRGWYRALFNLYNKATGFEPLAGQWKECQFHVAKGEKTMEAKVSS